MGDRCGRPPSPTDEEKRATWDRLVKSARSQKCSAKDSIKNPFWAEGVRATEDRSAACSTRHPFWVTAKTQYKLTEEICEGTFSIIYKAKEVGSGRLLAVKKFIKFQDQYKNFMFRKVVEEQWRILDAVRGGPHIIAVGTIRLLENPMAHPEMPMDYYEYDLSSLLQKTRAERGLIRGFVHIPAFFHTVLKQMLTALNYLHCEKLMVTHGGVNPTNILYTNLNHFVLCDFGTAEKGPPPVARKLDGMLEYLAPELYSHGLPNTAVDVWALGVVCLEMVGLVPVIGDQRHTFDMNMKLDWCTEMALMAGLLEIPELKMMVIEPVKERATASEVLRTMEEKQSRPKQRHRPSVDCLTLLLKYVGHLNLTSEGMRRNVAYGYLQRTDPVLGDLEATEPARRPVREGQDVGSVGGNQYSVSDRAADWRYEVLGSPQLANSDVLETILPSGQRLPEPGTRENPLGSTSPPRPAGPLTPEHFGRAAIMSIAPQNVGILTTAFAMQALEQSGIIGGRSSAASRPSQRVPAPSPAPSMGVLAAILTEGAVTAQRRGPQASGPSTSRPSGRRSMGPAPGDPRPAARSAQGGPSSSRRQAKGGKDESTTAAQRSSPLTRPTTQTQQGEPRPRPSGEEKSHGPEDAAPQAGGKATQHSPSPPSRSEAPAQSAAGASSQQSPGSGEASSQQEGKSDTNRPPTQSSAQPQDPSKRADDRPSESSAPSVCRGQGQSQRGKAQRGRKRR